MSTYRDRISPIAGGLSFSAAYLRPSDIRTLSVQLLKSAFLWLALLLVATGSAFAATDKTGQELLRALQKGQVDKALSIVAGIPATKINYPVTRDGGTLLHSVVRGRYRRNPEHPGIIVDALVKAGLDVNRRDNKNAAAIFYLGRAKQGADLLRTLVGAGADINARNRFGRTPLHAYAESGNAGLVSAALELGADLNALDQSNAAPVMRAAAKNRLDVVQRLIAAGADLKQLDEQDNSVMHYAAMSGEIAVFDYLLDQGRPLDERNTEGLSPMSVYAASKRWATVRLLAERGADTNVPMGRSGNLGLYLLMNPELGLSDLVPEGSVRLSDIKDVKSRILRAVSSMDYEGVTRLIALGWDVNEPLLPSTSAISVVVERNPQDFPDQHRMLKLLLDNGADINTQQGRNGYTPLMLAIRHRYPETVDTLLARGADVNVGKNGLLVYEVMSQGDYPLALTVTEAGMPVNFQNAGFWLMLEKLADKVVQEEAQSATPGTVTRLFNALLDRRPSVSLAGREGRIIRKVRDNLSNSESVTVLNSLYKVSFAEQSQSRSGEGRSDQKTSRPRAASRAPKVEPPTVVLPKRSYSDSARLHMIGVYKGEARSPEDDKPWWSKCSGSRTGQIRPETAADCHSKMASRHPERVVRVSVYASKEPVILALMAYEPTRWVIKRSANARIEGIILAGYYGQRVAGVTDEMPLDVFTSNPSDCGHCQVGSGSFFAYKRDSREFRVAAERLQKITGKSPVSFQGTYEGKSFSVIDRR